MAGSHAGQSQLLDEAGPMTARAPRTRQTDDGREHELARRFGRALRDGNTNDADAIAAEALEAGLGVAAVQSSVIAPAMRWIGELWQHGELTVGAEHLATAISQEVLGRLFPRALQSAPSSRERVMLAAVQGEHHVLGLRMAADVLEGAGFDVLYLGADVPLPALLETCRAHTPAMLGLTVSMPLNLPTFIWEIEEICALDEVPKLFAGGRAVGAAIAQGVAITQVDSTEQLVELVGGLSAEPIHTRIVPAELAAKVPSGAGVRGFGTEALGTYAGAFSNTALSGAEAMRESARHAYAMEQLAYRDPLTGLWNRRGYDDHYVELSETAGPDAMVLTIDVDRFKQINDANGHAAGDAVLLAVGKVMQHSVRPGDFVARYGGDEFAVLLPGASTDEATLIGERIRATVESELRDPPVTVSVGVAQALSSARSTALAVDSALYDAKENGRNRVVISAR